MSTNERIAYRSLKSALQIKESAPDLIIKAFKDLDTLFFLGRLHGNCLIRWRDPARCDHALGMTQLKRYGQASISLNAHGIMLKSEEPYMEIFRTVLHECW